MTLHFINYIGWLVIPGKAVGCCGVLIIYTWSDGGDSNYQYYTFFSAAVADRRLFDSLSRSSSQKILKKVYLVSVSYDWFSLLNEITFDVRDEYICLTMPLYYFPHFEYFWFHCNVGLKIYLQNYRKGVLMDKIIEYKILQHLSYYTTYSDNDNDLSTFVE